MDDYSGRLVFSSAGAAPPCSAAGAGGGQMLLFGGHGGFVGGVDRPRSVVLYIAWNALLTCVNV
jgi:hypothetical protein